MHETGLIRSLLENATQEATKRGAVLRGVRVRLGALAGGSSDHLREHFEVELERMQLTDVWLDVVEDPGHLSGIDIIQVELAERGS